MLSEKYRPFCHGFRVVQIFCVISLFYYCYRSFEASSITCRADIPSLTSTYWSALKLIFSVGNCFIMHEIRDPNTDRLRTRLQSDFCEGHYQTSCAQQNARMHAPFNIMSITLTMLQHELKIVLSRSQHKCLLASGNYILSWKLWTINIAGTHEV